MTFTTHLARMRRLGRKLVEALTPPSGYIAWLQGGNVQGIPTTDLVGDLSAFQIVETNKLIATDFGVVPSLQWSGTDYGTVGQYDFYGDLDSKPSYFNGLPLAGTRIRWVAANNRWEIGFTNFGFTAVLYNTATTTFPPTDANWKYVDDDTPADNQASYDRLFVSAGEFVARTKDEILANNADTDADRSSFDENGDIVDIFVYADAPTGAELAQLNDYLDSKHTTVPNHKSLETTFMLYDEADGGYHPVGLDNGAFVVLQGSGQNYTADGTTFKLIDINDGLYYPVGLENGAFVVLQGSGQNYTSTIFEFDLIDIGDSQFKKVFLSNGSFAVE